MNKRCKLSGATLICTGKLTELVTSCNFTDMLVSADAVLTFVSFELFELHDTRKRIMQGKVKLQRLALKEWLIINKDLLRAMNRFLLGLNILVYYFFLKVSCFLCDLLEVSPISPKQIRKVKSLHLLSK
jgi:hypothetical protein